MDDEFKQLATSLPRRTDCLTNPSISGHAHQWSIGRARTLLGCYRTGEAADPETYVAAISAVLSEYPEEIVTIVTDPRTGIPSKSNWLPTVAEVRAAADAEVAYRDRQKRRSAELEALLAERERDAQLAKDRAWRPTLDELKAKYGPNWGMKAVTDENDEIKRRARARMREISERTNAAISAEWGDQPQPTIAGIPISRSLADVLKRGRLSREG